MTQTASISVASVGSVSLALRDFLETLRRGRQLLPLLSGALAAKLIREEARRAGLSASTEELQQMADRFRQRHGLAGGQQTRDWLAAEGLTVEDFEAGLEADLLTDKFCRHLTAPLLADHFAAHRERYARARVRQIVVWSEGLARELFTQLTEEGLDFADLAARHSVHDSARAGGQVGVVTRAGLPEPAHVIFSAREGEVVGPVAIGPAFHLFLVEALLPPKFDADTEAAIRQELFDGWLCDQMRDAQFDLAWLRD